VFIILRSRKNEKLYSSCKLFDQSIDLSLFCPGDIGKLVEPRYIVVSLSCVVVYELVCCFLAPLDPYKCGISPWQDSRKFGL